jgi:hypothetical protein
MDDVKALLDGDGTPAAAATPGILETRSATCTQHGDYTDQQILIRSYSGYKPVALPYWLGCPECRVLMEQGNKREAKQWQGLLPGEPAWSPRNR